MRFALPQRGQSGGTLSVPLQSCRSLFHWSDARFALRTGYNDMSAQKAEADPKQGSQSGSFAHDGPNRYWEGIF